MKIITVLNVINALRKMVEHMYIAIYAVNVLNLHGNIVINVEGVHNQYTIVVKYLLIRFVQTIIAFGLLLFCKFTEMLSL